MCELRFRIATQADANRVCEIIHGFPGPEPTAMFGGEQQARRFGFALTAYQGRTLGWDRTVLAESGGAAQGVLQWRVGGEPALSMTPALAWITIRALGVRGAARAAYRERARRRVNPLPPAAAFHIEELHVDSRQRGAGIGSRLLAHAEETARTEGFPCLSLTTNSANPAQRLYRRRGFEVAEHREDAEYERITGIAGRVLMVKALTREPAA
jgi:ribosomal protein S18 acetylase RimI-like enzyme